MKPQGEGQMPEGTQPAPAAPATPEEGAEQPAA